jgi:Protein of unknown function (DUF3489)
LRRKIPLDFHREESVAVEQHARSDFRVLSAPMGWSHTGASSGDGNIAVKHKGESRMSKKNDQKPSVKATSRPKRKSSTPVTAAPLGKRRTTKGGSLLGLLQKPDGATIEEMMKASGWQAHSVRGFLSGTVKKRMRLTLKSIQPKEGDRRYMVSGV